MKNSYIDSSSLMLSLSNSEGTEGQFSKEASMEDEGKSPIWENMDD